MSSGSGGGGQPAAPIDCTTCGAVSSAGTVASALIDELSGLAASRLHGGILYGHNDSGDEPRFFAFDLAGAERGLFTVTAATARDWEDMAAGPCGDGLPGCLYFSDMGDNGEARDDLVLYRVAEPAQLGAGVVANLAVEAFPFSYPDGPHNAEAVMVHPVSGVVTIVTKGAAAAIFELRPPLAGDMVAVRIADYAAPASIVTGADVDAAGRTVAIRSYAGVYLYPMRPEQSVAEALAGASCTAPVAVEGQGEAVTFLFGSPGYVTASEGAAPVLHRVDCR